MEKRKKEQQQQQQQNDSIEIPRLHGKNQSNIRV